MDFPWGGGVRWFTNGCLQFTQMCGQTTMDKTTALESDHEKGVSVDKAPSFPGNRSFIHQKEGDNTKYNHVVYLFCCLLLSHLDF